MKALKLLLHFTLRLPFPSSSAVRWPYLPRICNQGERGRCWLRLLSHRGLRWSRVPAVRDPPLSVKSVPGLRPSHDVFLLTPPSALQDFLLASVLCGFPPLGLLLCPSSVPCFGGGGHGVRFGFSSDHTSRFGAPAEKQQRERHRGIITTAWALIRQGALEKTVSSNIHILYRFCQILLALLMSYFSSDPNERNVDGYEYSCWGYYPVAQRKSYIGSSKRAFCVFASPVCSLLLIGVLAEFFLSVSTIKLKLWSVWGSSNNQTHCWDCFSDSD